MDTKATAAHATNQNNHQPTTISFHSLSMPNYPLVSTSIYREIHNQKVQQSTDGCEFRLG